MWLLALVTCDRLQMTPTPYPSDNVQKKLHFYQDGFPIPANSPQDYLPSSFLLLLIVWVEAESVKKAGL